jgi:hypothetical protein
MMQKAPKIRNFKVSTLASALPLSSFDKPNATTAPHAEAARTRAMARRSDSKLLGFCMQMAPS